MGYVWKTVQFPTQIRAPDRNSVFTLSSYSLCLCVQAIIDSSDLAKQRGLTDVCARKIVQNRLQIVYEYGPAKYGVALINAIDDVK